MGMAMVASSSPELFVVPPLRRALRSEQAPDPLRDQLAAVVEQSALELLDPALIEAQAEDMRLIKRHRVHHAGLLTVALILSALQRSTDTEGRWLDAQRTYESIGGARSGKTSFRNNVRKLVPLMDRMLRRRLKTLAGRTADTELRGRLKYFADVLVPDGCAFKVATALSGLYLGTGTAAGAEVACRLQRARRWGRWRRADLNSHTRHERELGTIEDDFSIVTCRAREIQV